MRTLRVLFPSLLLLLAPLALTSCDDTTGPGTAPPTLDSLWPNEDGTQWSYLWYRTGLLAQTPHRYETIEEVPPVPSMEAAYQILVDGPGVGPTSTRSYFELEFEGTGSTESGAQGQNLVETVYVENDPNPLDQDASWRSFYEELLRFRPDLEDELASRLSSSGKAEIFYHTPSLLHGGIFEKTEDHIGTYGDAVASLAWLYLGNELEVGSRFDFQPLPSVDPEVWIHGLIRRQFTAEAAGARYPNSIECQYLIDYGIQGESLPVEAYSRQFTVGTIVFAPETGPIFSNERIGVDASLETTEGWEYNELTLLPSELPPPDRRAPAASLENIWPNADGDSWSYASDVVYGPTSRVNDPEAPLPSMSELYDWLHGSSEIDSVAVSERGYLGLQFDGMKTTESGATGQNLAETLRLPVESVLRSYEVETGTTFLSALLRARPDLEEAARRLYPASMDALEGQKRVILSDVMPLFLSGGAWEKTGQYIGSYGDVDQQLAWKYLESNLTPGHSFSFQLVPSLAEDVWLHVQVWRRLDFTLGEQRYRNCIEVLYALDFGIQVQVDEGGQTIGRYHSYAAGTLIYAPGVGPVQVLERELLAAPTPIGLDRNATLVEARVLESPMP